MHETKDRRVTLLQCVRVFIISLIAGAALLTLHIVISGSSQPARAWECEIAGAQAQAGTIRISPTLTTVSVGEIVTVEVWLEDIADYYGVDFRLYFNPNVVEAPSGVATPLWDIFDEGNHWITRNEADNINGTVWYALTNLNPAQPFTGTGRICSITFRAREVGTTTLDIYYAKGSTRNGEGLYPVQVDGEIVAASPVELTPTTDSATTPYAIQVYTLTLTNDGTTTDTFEFTHAATDTSNLPVPPSANQWGVEMPVSVTVGANLSKTINVTIVIPYDEVDWVTHTLNITATSGNHSTTANATLTTWTGGYWVANRPGPGGAGYVGCRHDINYSGDIDFYQDVQIVIGKYPGTDEPFYDYNHSGDIDFYQDVQRVIGKYPDECPDP
jgi:hypothetical protein